MLIKEAGKLILKASTEPVVYDGVTLVLEEEGLNAKLGGKDKKEVKFKEPDTPASSAVPSASTSTSAAGDTNASTSQAAFVPRAAMRGRTRPRAGLGTKRGGVGRGETGGVKEAPKFVQSTSGASGAAASGPDKDGSGEKNGLGQDAFRQMLAGKK